MCELIFYNLCQPFIKISYLKLADVDFRKVLFNIFLNIYKKLDYFYFFAFDLEVKAAEILMHILSFSGEKQG